MKGNMSLQVKFNNDFQVAKLNSEFVEGTALVAYVDENRNKSSIPEEAFEKAMYSLPLIPIVGNWIESKKNFGGHDVTIEISGGSLVFKNNTIPYGVVKENHNAKWVDIEENGTVKKYLQVDVMLWKGRYEAPIEKIMKDGANQSMEVNAIDVEFDKKGLLVIKEFEYSALCILGKDVDEFGNKGEDNVEPCFESASIIAKTNDDFKFSFDELKSALIKTDDVVEAVEGKDVAEFVADDVEAVVATTEVVETTKSKFMLNSLKRDLLREALPKQTSDAEDFNAYYWVMDFDDNFVYFEEEISTADNWTTGYFRCSYTESEQAVTVDESSKTEIFRQWLTQEELNKVQSEREAVVMSLQSEIDTLKSELDGYSLKLTELQAYKADVEGQIKQAKVNEMIEEFSDELKDLEEFETLKTNAMEMELDTLEKELFALVGKAKYSFKKAKKDTKANFSKVVPTVNVSDVAGGNGNGKDDEDAFQAELVKRYGDASKYFKNVKKK